MIDYKLGFGFSKGLRMFCFFIIACITFGVICGVLYNVGGLIVGCVIGLIPIGLILTFKYGVEIKHDEDLFREYNSVFTYKMGKWKKLSNYTDVSVLTMNKILTQSTGMAGMTAMPIAPNLDVSHSHKETGVYFLIPSHRRRVLLKICENKKEAHTFAEKISKEYKKELKSFNPQVSQTTKNRRR